MCFSCLRALSVPANMDAAGLRPDSAGVLWKTHFFYMFVAHYTAWTHSVHQRAQVTASLGDVGYRAAPLRKPEGAYRPGPQRVSKVAGNPRRA